MNCLGQFQFHGKECMAHLSIREIVLFHSLTMFTAQIRICLFQISQMDVNIKKVSSSKTFPPKIILHHLL